MIIPSKEEVRYVLKSGVDDAAVVGGKVNRTLKSFVKGPVLPATKFSARIKKYGPNEEVRYGDFHEVF